MGVGETDPWWMAADYAADVASVGRTCARDKGVPEERIAMMKGALKLLSDGDRDAFYVVVTSEYAAPAAEAVARMLRMRAEVESGPRDEPTDPVLVIPPPEASRGGPE
jgi:hypothetical protein